MGYLKIIFFLEIVGHYFKILHIIYNNNIPTKIYSNYKNWKIKNCPFAKGVKEKQINE